MATVNKNFRIKNGLIVEGGSATVNGYDVITKAQADQDYIVSLIGGTATSANTANTVVKRDASGNFAAGTITATFTGNLTGNVTGNVTGDVTGNVSGQAGTVTSLSGHSSDEISEGSTNKYYTDERAQDAIGNALGTGLSYNDTTGAISVTANTYDAYGAASAAQSAAATDATTKANAAQSAATTAAATDATSKANAAQAAAEATAASDATSKANAAQSAAISAAATDATTKANAAQAAAISAAATASTSAISAAISTEVSNRNTAISTAVDNLVDGAPALLNTLNELAAAINDDANYTTTITTALGTKAPLASPALTGTPTAPTAAANTDTTQIATTAFAKAEADAAEAAAISAAASDATSKANAAQSAATTAAATDATSKANAAQSAATTAAATDATSKANAAQSAAISAAATDATTKANAAQSAATTAAATDATSKANAAQAAAESTAATALTAVKNGTTKFTAVNVNDLVSQRAAQAVLASIATGSSVMSWAKSDYPTAKLWVKFATATHSQISEILLTTDSSNNIAITDFAETGTNGSLGTITASYVAGNIGIEVNTVYANTTVTVVATLIK
jgi:hypothetical protein